MPDPTPSDRDAAAPPPSPWVVRFAPLVPAGGAVLDLACGSGRHCRFFLDRGHPVTAVDRDTQRLGALSAAPGLTVVTADLETGEDDGWPLGGERFAGIVVVNYLWRPLLPRLADALEPGGALIYETFAVGNQRFGRPRRPEFLLKPGELLDAFAGRLSVVAYEHGIVERPAPAVVQRIAAVNRPPDDPVPLPPG